METPSNHYDPRLARSFILDELFDLILYTRLHKFSNENTSNLLEKLIEIEKEHFAFWQNFFGVHIPKLNFMRRVKLHAILLFCRFSGEAGTHLVLEAIEVHGIRKYLSVWDHRANKIKSSHKYG